jgi:hypothetical protein
MHRRESVYSTEWNGGMEWWNVLYFRMTLYCISGGMYCISNQSSSNLLKFNMGKPVVLADQHVRRAQTDPARVEKCGLKILPENSVTSG